MDNVEWLATNDVEVDHLIRIERLRRENPEEYMELVSACKDQYRRAVIAGVVIADGEATYDDIFRYTPSTRRTVRKHVYGFRDAGVLEVTESRPATITFASEAVEVLAKDVVSFLINR